MKCLTTAVTFIGFISTSVLADEAAGYKAGYKSVSFPVDYSNQLESGAVWYPIQRGEPTSKIGENGVFYGTEVSEDAPLVMGTFPVVLLSHGLGGNIRTLSWLAAGLAERGVIVVSVNHPHSTTGDMDMRLGLNHWTRTQDLATALDKLSADPQFKRHIDTTRIMAAGFSYGGWTALSLGGATGNLKGYAQHCAEVGDRSSHCKDIAKAGVSLLDVDEASWNNTHRDARITSVAAIEPALLYGLKAENVKGLVKNVLLIGLGTGSDRLFATDFSASGSDFEALLPSAKIVSIAPAAHFSTLLTCKPTGVDILKSDGDDPVCTDPPGADRNAVHIQIIDAIASELKQ